MRLVLACNQSSNRDPVVAYDEETVKVALSSLKEAGLLRFVHPAQGRSATRYRQVLDERFGLDSQSLSVLAVLVLRGPQTVGELRARTERMADFAGLDEVEAELERLSNGPDPLVLPLDSPPGPEGGTLGAAADRRDSRSGPTSDSESDTDTVDADGAAHRPTPPPSAMRSQPCAATSMPCKRRSSESRRSWKSCGPPSTSSCVDHRARLHEHRGPVPDDTVERHRCNPKLRLRLGSTKPDSSWPPVPATRSGAGPTAATAAPWPVRRGPSAGLRGEPRE